ncbi:hypothetical protein [Piscinibacter sp.]|uniref:hypothetical protein n=1 Tax=Piscinibacter sp. TaxID=1903157 RepID=UPI002C82057C|nr:hypothetical protein [Albitalea sp.]HUG22343.1 hypothetical protein [Albitalea sp.]
MALPALTELGMGDMPVLEATEPDAATHDVMVRGVSSFTLGARENRASATKLVDASFPFVACASSIVIHLRASPSALRRVTAALFVAANAGAHAQPAFAVLPGAQDLAPVPEAIVERRVDPWSRWTLRLYAEPSAGGDATPRAGMEARFVTQRLDAHQLLAGAALAFSPSEPDPVEAWQTFDDHRPSVFVEDRWQWSSEWSMTAGARLIHMPEGVAVHERLALAWQPAGAWKLRVTDGTLRLAPAPNEVSVQRYRGVEVQTEHAAGGLRLQALLASQQVSDILQSQVLHAAAVTFTFPLHERWSLGSETLIASQGHLTRLKLSGSFAQDQARVSLVVPHRFDGRPIDTALNGSLASMEDPDDRLGWRTQLELKF